MVRVAGIDIPDGKRVNIALQTHLWDWALCGRGDSAEGQHRR